MIENKKLANEPLTYNGQSRCPHCLGLSRLTYALLDTRQGNTLHVYECLGCGKRIWDEGPKLPARLQ